MDLIADDLEPAAPEVALLEWLLSVASQPPKFDSLKALNDGHELWQILAGIDPDYFSSTSLPEGRASTSQKWVARWQNLKHLKRALDSFVTNQCGQTIPQSVGSADLKAVAEGSDIGELLKVIKLLLLAAIESERMQATYIEGIMSLSTASQISLMEIIQNLQREAPMSTVEEPPSGSGHEGEGERPPLDQELLFEQRFGKIIAENGRLQQERKELQKEMKELHERLARLQENNTVLQDRLTKAEDELSKHGYTEGAMTVVRELEARIESQEELIANQETQLADYQARYSNSDGHAEQARRAQARAEALQDELDVLKAETDTLRKKANTLDKYRQKLQATHELENENKSLRGELEELRLEARGDEGSRQKIANLMTTIEEYKRLLPHIEQQGHETLMIKKQLELDNSILVQRCEKLEAQVVKDQDTLNELMKYADGGRSPRVSDVGALPGLAEELEGQDEDEKSAIRRRQSVLGNGEDLEAARARSAMLQQMLEDAQRKAQELDKKYMEEYAAKIILQSQLRELEMAAAPRSAIAGVVDQEQLSKQCSEIEELRKKLAELEAVKGAVPPSAREMAMLKQELQQVKRENKLVATSWYDLSSRMQMNTVTIQRRSEPPKGLLARSRIAIGNATAVRPH